jgi:hypothetical protein
MGLCVCVCVCLFIVLERRVWWVQSFIIHILLFNCRNLTSLQNVKDEV